MSVAVKLFIDKEKQRVLFAESDKDFVDMLFSFLTLPLGTIVRLLGKQSGVGCLDEVYKSVESLSVEHFQTEACKTMLLEPLNAAASHCERLAVKVDNTNPRSIYTCSSTCYEPVFSSVRNAICKSCKGQQYIQRELPNSAAVGSDADGVFVKSGRTLIITNDLQVAPASTCLVFSLLDRFGLNERADIKEEFLYLGYYNKKKMLLSLLKRTLISKEPLTGLYFDTAVDMPDAMSLDELPASMFPKEESKDAQAQLNVKIKLIQTADNSAVLYAEVGQDFVDLIFGLLGFPLGSIIKSYGQWPTNGCVDNLYRSVEGSAKECMTEGCGGLLVSPKLAPFFGCSINALQVEESDPRRMTHNKCSKCFKVGGNKKCTCYYSSVFYETNPKSTIGCASRAYMKGGLRNFIVTNDLRILHFSLANTLQVMRASNIPKEKLVEKELTLDKTHVLKLLRAAIATREALSSVLLPPKKKRRPHH